MLAIRYLKSVPRYLTARYLGPRFPSIYTSPLACLSFGQVEPPALPGAAWARVRPRLSGICGSDIATFTARGSPYFSPFSSTPFVLGHEVVGDVTEVGPDVDRVSVGQRVILQPPLSCRVREIEPRCPQCRAGNEVCCQGILEGKVSVGLQTGFCRDTGGGWSEGLVAHQLQLHPAPDDMDDELAVLIEPFSCAMHAVLKAGLNDSARVLIIGCGTMGALTLAAARKLYPNCRIAVVAKHPFQQQLARDLGADDVVTPGKDFYRNMETLLEARSFQPELGKPVFMGGADVCFDCVASSRTIDDSLRLTRGGGRVVLVGMPSIPKGVDWTAIWFKELTVTGSYTCDPGVFQRALGELKSLQGSLGDFVGAVFSLTQYKSAINCALNTGRSGVVKTAFRI